MPDRKNHFFKLPIRFNSLAEDVAIQMPICSELESIDQFIELLITTCPGEHKFDKNFGCKIWNMDFERVVSRKSWEDEFTNHITKAVQDFEQRLKEVSVTIQIMDVAREDIATKTTAIKKRVMIHINAVLVSSNEKCGFKFAIYLGPLSTE